MAMPPSIQAEEKPTSNGTKPNGVHGHSEKHHDPDVGRWLLKEKAQIPTLQTCSEHR